MSNNKVSDTVAGPALDVQNILRCMADARRDPDESEEVSDALKGLDRPFTLREAEGPYLWEGFVSFVTALWDVVRAVEPDLPAGLPAHLLDPRTAARFLGLPLERFNVQATHAKAGCVEDLVNRLESAAVRIEEAQRGVRTAPPARSGSETDTLRHVDGTLLGDTERTLVEALAGDTLTEREISKRAGYMPGSAHIKNLLLALRKEGILGNRRPGYYLIR